MVSLTKGKHLETTSQDYAQQPTLCPLLHYMSFKITQFCKVRYVEVEISPSATTLLEYMPLVWISDIVNPCCVKKTEFPNFQCASSLRTPAFSFL